MVAWKNDFKKSRFQEGLDKKSNCRFFKIAHPAESQAAPRVAPRFM